MKSKQVLELLEAQYDLKGLYYLTMNLFDVDIKKAQQLVSAFKKEGKKDYVKDLEQILQLIGGLEGRAEYDYEQEMK